MTPRTTPTPTPALAPVERPVFLDVAGKSVEVVVVGVEDVAKVETEVMEGANDEEDDGKAVGTGSPNLLAIV
jgi:hypothetical protein